MEMEIVKRLAASPPQRIAANRQNGQKSTGPRTPAGKRRVARNALKQGWRAAKSVDVERHAWTPADSGPAGGLERGARSRPECGRCVDKTGPREEGR